MPSPRESDPPPPEEDSRPTPADDALDGADDDDDDDDDDHPRGEEALRRRVMALSKLIGLPASTDEARDARCSARIHRGRLLLAEAVAVTSRDARSSELRPLLGTDPDTLSQMALSDAAEALAHAPGHEDAHMLRIRAAERAAPNDVRRFVIEALAFFPGHEGLLKTLSGLPGSDTVTKRVRPETAADRAATKPGDDDEDDDDDVAPELECVLCLKLLHVPVTTPCGHSFCKHCLASALDHNRARQQCPLCRAPLHMSVADHAPTVALQSIIERIYPERCARRAAEVRRLTTGGGGGGAGSAAEITVPLFVVGVMFPGHSARFNIFEPRYRLMMRRCLDGSRTFGVVQHVSPGDDNARHAFGNDDENGGSFSAVGCLVRIVDCQVQPDGRLVMTVQGEKRFRVARSWETDGYRVADVRIFGDADVGTAAGPGATDDAGSEVDTGTDEASTFAASSAAGTHAAMQELATMLRAALVGLLPPEAAGQLPSLSEPEPTAAEMERLSLWGCGAVAGAAGLDQLASTSTAARLQFCIDRIPERRPRCSPM